MNCKDVLLRHLKKGVMNAPDIYKDFNNLGCEGSVSISDLGFSVTCDGVQCGKVYLADSNLGFVSMFKVDDQGNEYIDEITNDAARETVYGTVEFFIDGVKL